MGIDVSIYVRTKDGAPPTDPTADRGPIWGGSTIRPPWGAELMGATHYIATGDRYWDEHGDEDRASRWPQIRETLVRLMAECEAVWYMSDVADDPDSWTDYGRQVSREESWRIFSEQTLMTPARMALIDAAYKWATAGSSDDP